MKFFAVFLLLAFVAVALAKPTKEEKTETTKVEDGVVKAEEGARDKRGVFVGTYAAPYVYSPYTLPVSYQAGYSVPYSYSYSYRTYPTYYNSPLVVY